MSEPGWTNPSRSWTLEAERNRYREQLLAHLRVGGYAIFSVFADDGPEKCSELTIRRHGKTDLEQFMGAEFELVYESRTIHQTPSKAEQKFINVLFQRRA